MITSLSFSAIKGRSGSYTFTPVTAILGQNAAGKTAILDALDWLTIGYVPRRSLGKTNADLFKLASGPAMQAEMVAYGQRVWRRLERRGESVTCKKDGEMEFPKLLRDHDLYFGLSDEARVALVASLVEADGKEEFSVPAILAAVKNVRLEENTEASEKAVMEAYNALAGIVGLTPKLSALDWLSIALTQVKDAHKVAAATRKRMTSVNTGLTQLQTMDGEQARCAVGVESWLREARTALGVLQAAAGAAAFAVNDAKSKAQRLGDLQAHVDSLSALAGRKGALDAERDRLGMEAEALKKACEQREFTTEQLWGAVARLEEQARRLRDEVWRGQQEIAALEKAAADTRAAERLKDAVAARDEAAKKAKECAARVAFRNRTLASVAAEVEKILERRSKLVSDYTVAKQQAVAIETEIAEFTKYDHCPVCLASGTSWKVAWMQVKEALAEAIKKRVDVSAEAGTAVKAELERAKAALTKAREEDEEDHRWRHVLTAKEQEVKTAQVAADAAVKAAAELAALKTKLTAKEQQAKEVAEQLAAAKLRHAAAKDQDDKHAKAEKAWRVAGERAAEAASAADKLAALNDELAALGSVDEAVARQAHSEAESAVEAGQRAVADLEQQAKCIVLKRADIKRQTDAVRAAEDAEAQCGVLKAVKDLLEEKQAALVGSAFGSLLGTVNKLTRAVLSHDIVYFQGEMGYWNGGSFASASTFSGAEELVAYAGLTVALAAKAERRVAILDEMTRLVGANKGRVLEALAALVRGGTLHQAIVVDGPDAACYDEFAAANLGFASVIRV